LEKEERFFAFGGEKREHKWKKKNTISHLVERKENPKGKRRTLYRIWRREKRTKLEKEERLFTFGGEKRELKWKKKNPFSHFGGVVTPSPKWAPKCGACGFGGGWGGGPAPDIHPHFLICV